MELFLWPENCLFLWISLLLLTSKTWVTFAEKPQIKIKQFWETKPLISNSYLIRQRFERYLSSLHGGSLEITLTGLLRGKTWTNISTLLVWVSVCLCLINVKTVEPIGPKFCVGPSYNSRDGLWMIDFSKTISNKIQFLNIFVEY